MRTVQAQGSVRWLCVIVGVISFGCRPAADQSADGDAEPPPPPNPRLAEGIATPPGFQAEMLYEVPRDRQGSWISLCAAPDGRLFVSDQNGALYQINAPALGDFETETVVEPIEVAVGGAHGLCWAFDALYVMSSGVGLHRVTDSDSDGTLDASELLLPIEGAGEHGPHAIVVAPDGENLLIVCGNHTALPELTSSRVPMVWDEDQLLQREWDARGHARGVLAPGGYVCRVSPDASEVELISIGYRNPYDLAVSPAGEVFTHDADMEWDMGMPWYRPTRVCQVVSGSEFGWRSGTGKWPAYYPDSLPPVVDIGPGSPVGMTFGTGAAFPAEFQRSLFLLDWTFGTMYTLRLAPDGATYSADAEEFLHGKPLPLTDIAIGADGAMYFVTGGRGTQSHLYRVFYYGVRDTAPVAAETASAPEATLRRELEALHRADAPAEALERVWPALGHPDRFVRYAARTALEHQPASRWRERAVSESDPASMITAALALCRTGSSDDLTGIVGALSTLDAGSLPTPLRLDALRAFGLAFARFGPPDETTRAGLVEQLDARFPCDDPDERAELARLLVYLRSPTVVEKCLTLMEASGPPDAPDWAALVARNDDFGGTIQRSLESPAPTEGLYYAFVLRNVDEGWTHAQRRRYFAWLAGARQASGGASYVGFLEGITSQALATVDPTERSALDAYVAALAASSHDPGAPAAIEPAGPGRAWTLQTAISAVEGGLRGRSFDRGAGLFQSLTCAACHLFDGRGGAQGPDLSSVASTFNLPDLLAAIVEPSKNITDQYAWSDVTTGSGARYLGRIVGETESELTLMLNAFDPGATTVVKKDDVLSIEPMAQSPMPAGLVNPLSEHELRDLVAYLLSGGDRDDPMFDR